VSLSRHSHWLRGLDASRTSSSFPRCRQRPYLALACKALSAAVFSLGGCPPPDAHRQIAWLTGETKENSGRVSGRPPGPRSWVCVSAAKSEVQAISSRGPSSFLAFLLPTTTPYLHGAVASHSLFLSIRSLHSLPSFSEVHHSFTLFCNAIALVGTLQLLRSRSCKLPFPIHNYI